LLVDSFEGRKVLFLGGPNMKEKSQGQNDLNELAEVKGDIQGKDIVQISCGDYHGAAIDSLGNLYTWGGGKTA
jgi:alpha-tubulin suppressor-like RCC1 family protein